MKFGYTKKVDYEIKDALSKLKEILPQENFGVIFEIDFQNTLKQKMDVDIEDYVILGVCNPKIANIAYEKNIEIGLLLPCNIIVYTKDNKNYVSSIQIADIAEKLELPEIKDLAKDAQERLIAVIDKL